MVRTAPRAIRSRRKAALSGLLSLALLVGVVPALVEAAPAAAATVAPMYTWGRDFEGELADGSTQTAAHANPGAVVLAPGVSPVAVDAGNQFALAIGSDGNLYSWGAAAYGELGIGGYVNPPFYVGSPQHVTLPDGVRPTAVAAGYDFGLAIGSDGTLYGWGDNEVGQLGIGSYGHDKYSPVPVALPSGAHPTAIAAGGGFGLAIGSDGTLYAWGDNTEGTVGDGSTAAQVHAPVPVSLPAGVHATAISAGIDFALAIGSDGTLYAWGTDYYGELGDGNSGSNEPTRLPTPVTFAAGVHAVAISAGNEFATAIGSDGNLYTWGRNVRGDLGDGGATDRHSPTRVTLPSGVHPATLAAGAAFATMIATDGTLYTWGGNYAGQLGDGTFTDHDMPEKITLPGGATAAATAAGGSFTVAITQLPPRFVSAAPPARAAVGATIDYTFAATGLPTPTYALSGAPPWLSIDPTTGELTGTVPQGASTFSYSVTATSSAGSAKAGPFTLTIEAAVATVSGTVVAQAGNPVAGAAIDVCSTGSPGGSVCATATTDQTGAFTATAGVGDTVSVTAYPPPSAGLLSITSPARTVPAAGLSDVRLVLPVPVTTGAGGLRFTYGASYADEGMPGLNWLTWPSVAVSGCADGVALASIVGFVPDGPADFGHWAYRVSPLTEQPAGSGSYAGAIDPLYPIHGFANVTGSVACLPQQVMSPLRGPAGTTVRAMGIAVSGVTAVRFGSTPAASFTDLGHGLLEAIAPPGSGTVPVIAETAAGSVTLGSYTYGGVAAAPAGSVVRAGTAVAAQLSPAISLSSILQWLYDKGPGFLSNLLNLKSAITGAINEFHLTCQSAASAVASAISAALGPLLDSAVDAALPEIEEFVLAAFAETGPAALVIAALTPLAVHYVAGKLFGALINAAVQAAFNALVCPHHVPPRDVLVDPSGTVLDTHGNPVGGATVTILRADTASGPFTPVDVTQPGIRPAVNPETTGADGTFHWDVRSGSYEVQAAKSGCTLPNKPAETTAVIGPYPVPPPQVGLAITLACPDEAPAPTPTVGHLDVAHGPAAGGTRVLITGSGFSPAARVTFGPNAATVTYLSPEVLSVLAPAGSGHVDVVVHTAGGASATSTADRFFYGGRPAVTGLSMTSGPAGGGTKVTITGSGFTGASVVGFGGVPATDVHVLSDTELVATTAAQLPGTYPVVVVGPAGASAESATFTFRQTTTATTLTPDHGPATGGTAATVTGTGFVAGKTTVTIGTTTVPAGAVTVTSATSLQFTTPAGMPGPAAVTITSPNGTSAPALTFTYDRITIRLGITTAPSAPSYGQDVTVTVTTIPARPGAPIDVSEKGSTLASGTAGPDGTAALMLHGLHAGTHVLTISYPGDHVSLPATATATVVVAKAATQLTIDRIPQPPWAAPIEQVLGYLHQLTAYLRHPTVTAHLARTGDGAPIGGAEVLIETRLGAICTATTDASGTVTCDVPRRMQALVLHGLVRANYRGSPDYLPTSSGPAVTRPVRR